MIRKSKSIYFFLILTYYIFISSSTIIYSILHLDTPPILPRNTITAAEFSALCEMYRDLDSPSILGCNIITAAEYEAFKVLCDIYKSADPNVVFKIRTLEEYEAFVATLKICNRTDYLIVTNLGLLTPQEYDEYWSFLDPSAPGKYEEFLPFLDPSAPAKYE